MKIKQMSTHTCMYDEEEPIHHQIHMSGKKSWVGICHNILQLPWFCTHIFLAHGLSKVYLLVDNPL